MLNVAILGTDIATVVKIGWNFVHIYGYFRVFIRFVCVFSTGYIVCSAKLLRYVRTFIRQIVDYYSR